MTLTIGSLIYNRYRIEKVLAQGGMGAIYRAVDESLGVVVALKENLITTEDSSRQFHREATILAGLRHPNLPRVTDHFTIHGQGQYLVMDFIEGEDLKQKMTRIGHLQEREVAEIAVTVCEALDYLHNLTPPVVHRDIKPGNIKISPSGQVFLVDFGLAKMAASGEQTMTGAQALTPGFAPPEQYGKGTDWRSDIYGLGATLYTLLTGKVPEDGLARALGEVKLTPLRSLNPQVSEKMEKVILTAMSVLPEQRYQRVKDLQKALIDACNLFQGATVPSAGVKIQPSNFQNLQQTIAKPVKDFYPPASPAIQEKPKRKISLPIILSGILVLGFVFVIAVAGILYATGFFDPLFTRNQVTSTHTSAPVAEVIDTPTITVIPSDTAEPSDTATSEIIIENTPIVTLTMSPTQAIIPTDTLVPTLAATPIGGGGGKIAFASDREQLPQIYVMSPDGSNVNKLTSVADGACGPDWSPDGSQLVFQSPCRQLEMDYKGSRLFLINADGSGLTPLNSVPGGDYDPAWSPDGKMIAFTSIRSDQRPHIYIYNLDDNSTTLITSSSSYDRRPVWSPDGQYIAFETSRTGKPEVWYMNNDGSGAKEFSKTNDVYASMPAWSNVGDIIYFSIGRSLPALESKIFSNPADPGVKVSDVRPVFDAEVSPDGVWIAFYTLQDISVGNRDIYIMLSTGGNLTRLTTNESSDFHPAWY